MNKLENKYRQNRVPLSPQQTEAQRFALGFFVYGCRGPPAEDLRYLTK